MLRWLDILFPPRADEKALRGLAPDDFAALLDPRQVPDTRPPATALLPFSDTRVRAAIHEAKYHGNERAFDLLADTLAEYLLMIDEADFCTFSIIPIPLSKKRRRMRGYNQVEEVARRAAEKAGGMLVETTLLTRVRDTESQTTLSRAARKENVRDAFKAVRKADPSYTYIILDDVLTTGATLQEAIDALIAAGARHVIPLALAH